MYSPHQPPSPEKHQNMSQRQSARLSFIQAFLLYINTKFLGQKQKEMNKNSQSYVEYVSHQPLHSQKCTTTKRHQAFIYPGFYSIHKYKIPEPETRENEQEFTKI